MSGASSDWTSRGSIEFTDDDIPYYKSFDGSSMVASYTDRAIVIDLIVVDPGVSEKVLEAIIVKEVGYVPTRKKIRDGKKIATMKFYGSWEQSYQKLPLLMNVLQIVNRGMCVDWYFKEHGLGGHIPEVVRFKRVFWTFKPCIDAFVHCILVLQIDGTHLYGKYKGVLLTATTIDGFNHLLPVAFAIVEGENVAS
ncbi:MULE domain-containing protein [Heracleum sosnowskyi]|uniref:MULE domain-containing protein n=1 Tax=Heracleum sosnowskyi TaxID=360622 RepID=A0AAD8J124_9APIA|nr:MULE domain-containing protein [Heracleum sosnowskyi]